MRTLRSVGGVGGMAGEDGAGKDVPAAGKIKALSLISKHKNYDYLSPFLDCETSFWRGCAAEIPEIRGCGYSLAHILSSVRFR